LIDGVLQLEFPASPLAAALGGPPPTLVVGRENALIAEPLARLLAATDLATIADRWNPLVLVGPSGSGKSLVAQGVIRAWSERLGSDAVAYFTAADFGRERQAAEADERLAEWRSRMRDVRLAVIDDVDQLRQRETIQSELCATIDAIIETGGVIVATAAHEPFLCPGLDAAVRDRLVAGLTVRLERPSLATRRAILEHHAAARGLTLDGLELERLAVAECATPAQLIGRLNAYHQVTSDSLPSAGRAGEGGEFGTRVPPPPQPSPQGGGSRMEQLHALKHLTALAARFFGVTQAAITSKSRRTSLVEARNVIVHLARRTTDLSYADIGRALGGRDHTTIMHADRRLAERLTTDPTLRHAVEELERLVM
jgi:chromosomal replication initiator protein